jgi:hypothetical protein
MRAFEVHLNGKRLCVAGIDGDCVLNVILNHVAGRGRNELWLSVGGLISATEETLAVERPTFKAWGQSRTENCRNRSRR